MNPSGPANPAGVTVAVVDDVPELAVLLEVAVAELVEVELIDLVEMELLR